MRNQAFKSSVNSIEHSSSEKIFQILGTCLIKPSLVAGRYHQQSSTTSMFLILASACNPVENDRKASIFSFSSLSWLHPHTISSSMFETSICFQIPTINFASCCLPMAITTARFIGVRHANIRWKSEEDVYVFGIQSPIQSVQHRIPAAFIKFNKAYLQIH
jgi:hypothetical protein